MVSEHIVHSIPPTFDENSRVLVLGSIPSPKSRETQFNYGHPQNRFWRVTSSVTNSPLPVTVEEKKSFLLLNGIAVWDVIASCDITGSSDSSIKNVTPNDLTPILSGAKNKAVFTNGKTAHNLYQKYVKSTTGREDVTLPSTSPANAAWTLDRLISAWSQIKEYL